MESSVLTYFYHHLFIGNCGIIKKANTEAFQNKDINEKIKILNENLLNIFNNFIPNQFSNFFL